VLEVSLVPPVMRNWLTELTDEEGRPMEIDVDVA